MRDEIETTEAPAAPQRKLTPANENPWYVLLTLYGEQEGDDPILDRKRWEDNRRLWLQLRTVAVNTKKLDNSFEDAVATRDSSGKLKAAIELHKNEMLRRNGDDFECPGFPDLRQEVNIGRCRFEKNVNLSGFHFSKELIAGGSEFLGEFQVGEAVFKFGLSVANARFCKGFEFSRGRIEKSSNFSNVEFYGFCNFDECRFEGVSNFCGSSFLNLSNGAGVVSFKSARFGEEALFTSVHFVVPVVFTKANFQSHARFGDVFFEGETWFGASTFERGATFSSSTFLANASFTSTVFQGVLAFNKVQFLSRDPLHAPDFSESLMEKPANFREAKFRWLYPNFEDSILHERTRFTVDDNEKNRVSWPEDSIQDLERARESCATIRHLVAKQGLPEDEHFFFRREMHFASKIGPIWQRLPYLLFGWFSDYGYSIARPFWWLFAIWLFGTFVIAEHFVAEPAGPLLGSNDWTAMALSFSNLFPVFGFGRAYFGVEFLQALPQHLKVLSGVQTVASLPLLFFLGLGLRQRFRLR